MIWWVSDSAPISPGVGPPERVLPDGCIEWIFHLGAPFQQYSKGQFRKQARSFIVGELTQFIMLQPTGPTLTMGVRFRPGGAYRFVPAPLDLFTNQAVATEDIWGVPGKHVQARVLDAGSQSESQNLVETFLVAFLQRSIKRTRFEAAVADIVSNRGQCRVDSVAEKVGISRRQLEREFRAHAGLSPKALARIIRFQNLLRMVGENKLRDWTEVALASGYADQPHMVREFGEFCGYSPTATPSQGHGPLTSNFVSPRRLAALLGTH